MPFHPSSEQKQLIRNLINLAANYRQQWELYPDTPVGISIPLGAETLWCEQIEQILANHKIYVVGPKPEGGMGPEEDTEADPEPLPRQAWTPDMNRALDLIVKLYSTSDGVIGGPLHVQLDDENLYDDQSFNHDPINYTQPPEYQWEDEALMRQICDELLPLLMSIPEHDRINLVRTFHAERR